jgi:hypothetical protein
MSLPPFFYMRNATHLHRPAGAERNRRDTGRERHWELPRVLHSLEHARHKLEILRDFCAWD